jgi:hypothetical protein
MTRKEAEDDMVQGFMDGYDLNAPAPSGNRSHSYRHGFANGRRDKGLLPLWGNIAQAREMAENCIVADMHGGAP